MAAIPTGNEQATFQPILGETGAGGPGGNTVPGAALGAVSTGIAGAASIFDVLAGQPLPPDQASEELVANKADLESELVGEVSLIGEAGIPGGTFRQAKGDVDRVAASFRQGRMSQQETNIRLASVVQRYIAGDPRNAETYRDLARNVLGVVPTQEVVAQRRKDTATAAAQQEAIITDEANFAISKGVVVADGLGGINRKATALEGRSLRAMEARQEALKDTIEMQKLLAETDAARKLTQVERDNIEYQETLKETLPLIESRLGGVYEALKVYQQGPEGTQQSREEQIETISNTLAIQKSAALSAVNGMMLTAATSPTTRRNILDAFEAQWAPAEEMLTGDLSEFANTVRANQTIDANAGNAHRKIAPLLNTFRVIAGEEITQGYLQEAAQKSVAVNTALATEAHDVAIAALQPNLDIITGERGIQQMNPTEKGQAVKGTMKALDTMNRKPQSLTPNQKQAYKLGSAEMITAALDTDSVNDRANGTQRLSTNRNLIALDVLRANDPEFEEVGEALRDLNAQAFVESVRRTPSDTTINQLIQRVGTRGRSEIRQFSPVYNGATGVIEIHSVGRDGKSKLATERLPPGMADRVTKMNSNLNAITHLKDYGGSDLGQFSEKQIKQGFVLSTSGGITISNEDAFEPIPGGLLGFFGVAAAEQE